MTVKGKDHSATAVTSKDGLFRLDNIPAGKYEVLIDKDGYTRRDAIHSIDIHRGGCAYDLETLVQTGRL